MNDNFLFGNLFVKASRPLALVTLIFGMVLSGILIYQWKVQQQSLAYKNNPELIKSLTVLLRDYSQTKNKVMQLHSQLMISAEEDVKLYVDPEIYEDYTKVEHFADLKLQLQNVAKNSALFKDLIYKNFSDSVDFLLGKMRDYALLKKWIDETSEAEAPKVEGQDGEFYLIASPAETYEKNLELLKKSIDYLNDLKASVENPESKVNVSTMLNHLQQYQNIMRKVNVALTKTDNESSEDDSGSKRRIFIIMDELELMKKNIYEAATTNWTVDKRYSESMALVEQESGKCQEARMNTQKLHFDNALRLAAVLVFTLFLSAGILIFSDVFRALFKVAFKE